jgi:two-component system cell cycle response regulator DivK
VNGAEALAAVERERPDLVLMDLDMPVMNGWEAIEHIRANPEVASLPIIVLSAHALLGDEEKAMPGQCDGFLPKPFNTQQVMALIGEILERGREPASDVSE